jgi:cytochrome c553
LIFINIFQPPFTYWADTNMTPLFTRLAARGLATLTPLALGLAAMASPSHAAVVGNPAAAKAKVAMCVGCHNIEGYQASFPEIHKVPKIAGQNAQYIAAALAAYQKGDRKHPTMKGVATSLTEQDMADIAAYYETLGQPTAKAAPKTAPAAPAAVASLLNKGACATCHGADLNRPTSASYPKLAGQHADYLLVALKSYQASGNHLIGRNNAIMVGQAKQFNVNELKLLANHIASLPGDLKTVPQPKFKR